MNMNYSRLSAIALGSALLAGVLAAALMWVWPFGESQPSVTNATVLPEGRPLPQVSLVDDQGMEWSTEALTGGWHWVFFGFTHCPDVCPTTLAHLAGALDTLRADAVTPRPKVVLISIDPQRDTPERLGRYVDHFDPTFTGVTGSAQALETLTQALGISYTLHAPDATGQYAVDHSSAILLINPQGQWQALWQPPHGREVLAREFQAIQSRYRKAHRQ